ncbi:hypothetical protein MUN88_16495 [Gracilibacillus caseinilyticus]|uniref:Uncharacterized protein n=1 Tax=Gracilibacillus caseinilyticus TaxID=2932256 RepID=A0ABY4EVF9_9BACI|nr:hypothetical protein [Gracilibacillus caseinilyticus]UOQ47639.1 hypothetical protein MUN88_16495 [Gracilibacillus caseinilyticus]
MNVLLDIPIDKGEYYKEVLFTSYIDGLRESGWNGDATLPKYGFYVSFALRSAWEMPKIIKLAADSIVKSVKEEIYAIEILTRITRIQIGIR